MSVRARSCLLSWEKLPGMIARVRVWGVQQAAKFCNWSPGLLKRVIRRAMAKVHHIFDQRRFSLGKFIRRLFNNGFFVVVATAIFLLVAGIIVLPGLGGE